MLLLSIILMFITICAAAVSMIIADALSIVILAIVGDVAAAIAITILVIELIKKNSKKRKS